MRLDLILCLLCPFVLFVDASAINAAYSSQSEKAVQQQGSTPRDPLHGRPDEHEKDATSPLEGRGILIPEDEFDRFKIYAEFAGASYCESTYPIGSPVFCKEDICPAGHEGKAKIYSLFYGTVTDIFGFVSIYTPPSSSSNPSPDPRIVISVRGSQSLQNFLTDAVFASTSCERDLPRAHGCLAHAGFHYAFREIADDALDSVRKALADLTTPERKHAHDEQTSPPRIVVTGHSLGGAVATLLGAFLREKLAAGAEANDEMPPKVDIYSFGSPRVGNEALADFIGKQPGREFRVTHYRDVVPRLPPMMFGFRHTTPEYFLADGPHSRLIYRPDEIQDCHGTSNDECNASFWFPDIVSHMYYLVAISSCGTHRIPSKLLAGLIDDAHGNATEIADPEIKKRFEMYAKLDMAYADDLKERGGEKMLRF